MNELSDDERHLPVRALFTSTTESDRAVTPGSNRKDNSRNELRVTLH